MSIESSKVSVVNLRGEWLRLDSEEVTVLDVSEDMFGEDVCEFSYLGEVYTAKIHEVNGNG